MLLTMLRWLDSRVEATPFTKRMMILVATVAVVVVWVKALQVTSHVDPLIPVAVKVIGFGVALYLLLR